MAGNGLQETVVDYEGKTELYINRSRDGMWIPGIKSGGSRCDKSLLVSDFPY